MYLDLLKRFKEDERGTATIESLLWIPLFFFIFILIIDASFVFFGKAQMLRIVQTENRALAIWVGEEAQWPAEELAAELRLKSRIEDLMIQPSASEVAAIEADVTKVGQIIQTVISAPGSSLMAVGTLPEFSDFKILVQAQHQKEK